MSHGFKKGDTVIFDIDSPETEMILGKPVVKVLKIQRERGIATPIKRNPWKDIWDDIITEVHMSDEEFKNKYMGKWPEKETKPQRIGDSLPKPWRKATSGTDKPLVSLN